MYNEIRTVAFRFAPDVKTVEREFFTLDFPEHWKPLLLDLQSEIVKRPRDQVRIPIRNLNQALRALVPDLISIVPNAGQAEKQPWLYSATPISIRALHLIVQAWLKTSFSGASAESRERVRQQLKSSDLQWKSQAVDLAKQETHLNGTSKPEGNVFTVLPDYLAAQLSYSGVSIDIHGVPFRFRRCPLAPGSSGAELVSWPPIQDTEPWSLVLLFTVQTVPFQEFPVIYCDSSVRRWMKSSPTYIDARQTSVALLTHVPWLPELPNSTSFQVASLKWQWIPETERQDGQSFRLVWSNHLVDLLNELQLQQPFPNVREIRENPEAAMNLNGTPNALIYYRNAISPSHAIGTGLWPGDRQPIAEQLAVKLSPNFRFTERPKRFVYRITPKREKNPFSIPEKDTDDSILKQRRKLVGEAVGGKITIEIRHQTTPVRNALVNAICEILGLQKPDTLPYTWSTDELTLTLAAEQLGELAEVLEIDTAIKDKTDRLHRAIFRRINRITQQIPQTKEIMATFVELQNWQGNDKDPKTAIRLGFAHTNRITQFITPLPAFKSEKQEKKLLEQLAHRAKACFLDLLRQLGVQAGKPEIHLKNVPVPLHYAGLWLVKQYSASSATRIQQFLPVIVYMNSASTDMKVMANGFTDWLPYREAVLAIAQGKATGFDKEYKALPFIQKHLKELAGLGDVIVLCHAQKLRRTWKWLQNRNITTDAFTVDERQPVQPIERWKGLRIVRIRDSQGHETPEWYGQDGEKVGLPKGLFQINERVFASTADKSGKFKSSPRASKIASYTSAKGKVFDPEPDKQAWNPGLYEITVACKQPHDEAWIWAAVAHELRSMTLNSTEATALPLPLHLAKQLKEYTLPLPEEDED